MTKEEEKGLYEVAVMVEQQKNHSWRLGKYSGKILYSPVVCCGSILFESKRLANPQRRRIELFPDDFNQESVLEVGTNTGFVLLQLKRYNNTGKSLGIDLYDFLTEIPSKIAEIENLQDIEFKKFNIFDDIPDDFRFDNSLLLSVTEVLYESYPDSPLDFERLMDQLKIVTKKAIYVEPTNHTFENFEQVSSRYIEFLSRWGSVEILGVTDYQDRVMFKVSMEN